MDLLRKSYTSVVLRSPLPATLPSAEDTKSAAAQPPLYLRRGKRSGAGGCAAGAASQQGVSFGQSLVQSFDRALIEPRAEL